MPTVKGRIAGDDVVNKLLLYEMKHSDWRLQVTWLFLTNQSVAKMQWVSASLQEIGKNF